MRGTRLLIFAPLGLALALASLGPAGAQRDGGGVTPLPASVAVRLPLFKAFTKGKAVFYTNFEVSDLAMARSLRATAFAPRLARAKDDGTDEFFLVTNGVSGQQPILGSPPGDMDYSPMWRFVRITWKAGAARKLLTSEADIDAQGSNITEQETPVRFNCPVLLISDDLQLTNLRPAPTLALGPQLISWDINRRRDGGSTLFRVEGAWHDGLLFAFLDLEGAPRGLAPNAPAVAAVPKLSLSKIAGTTAPPHDPVANFYTVQFQAEPVIDSVPLPDDQDKYSPLWAVHLVTFNMGKRPRPLHSEDEVKAAAMAGDVTIVDPTPDSVFNCPVIDARATVSLPRAADEIRFLMRAGLLPAGDGNTLLNDLRLRNGDQFIKDVQALVTGGKLKPETGQLLLALT